MKKIQYILCGMTILLFSFCNSVQENDDNATQFYKILTAKGGTWVAKVNDSLSPFVSYTMTFQFNDKKDTLFCSISGLHKDGTTMKFWDIKEYREEKTGKILTYQTNGAISILHPSDFIDSKTRIAEFEIAWEENKKQKIKDIHTIVNEHVILSESSIFDPTKNTWVMNSKLEWKSNNLPK